MYSGFMLSAVLPECREEEWLIDEEDLGKDLNGEAKNSIFTISNGFIGCRGALPFSTDGVHGTFIGGINSEAPAGCAWIPGLDHPARNTKDYPSDEDILKNEKVKAIPVAPNLWKLGTASPNERRIGKSTRILDLHNGILTVRTEFENRGRKWLLECLRFTSLSDRNLCVERLVFTPCGHDGPLEISLGIDDRVRNRGKYDLWEGRKIDFPDENILLWNASTSGTAYGISICTGFNIRKGTIIKSFHDAENTCFKIEISGKTVIDRYTGVATGSCCPEAEAIAGKACRSGLRKGIDIQLEKHIAVWKKYWPDADIMIDGPIRDQQAVRYCIFQTLASVPRTDKYSIGAKLLSGEYYNGNVFWDTDVFIISWLCMTFPERAREHLIFRYRTLDAAKRRALEKGFKGAMYPWQSTPTGEEGTAPWNVLGETQVHVTADVAWGVLEYLDWTGDTGFMEEYGNTILAECSRFWASRCDEGTGNIGNVCGPDEDHPFVKNNAYTNHLVKHLLERSAEICESIVSAAEREEWKELSRKIAVPGMNKSGVLEQYDGFFRLPFADKNMKHMPSDKYQILKQADVMAIPFLFHDCFNEDELRANFDYYEPITTHMSSLSAGVYAVAAARAGYYEKAYALFEKTAFTDLMDEYWNTSQGLHAAASSNTALVICKGFLDIRIVKGRLIHSARLPAKWRRVELNVKFRGRRRKLKIDAI
jgi:trehalose/maltose hydrolase-like predicted phosphorylase